MNFLIALVVLVTLCCLFLMWREPRMVYYPDRTPFVTPPGVTDLQLTASDGVKIHGWYVPGPTTATQTVLFLHGNASNLSDRNEKIDILRQLDVNVCIIDYRGYGRSAGEPNEAGTYRDARAAYDYLTKTLNREPRTVILYGESLGTGMSVELATRVPVGGVILEAGFTSIGDVAQGLFPFLPVRYLVRNKYDSIHKIAALNAPLLLLHSREDEVFAYRHAERLFAAAREPKRLVELHGGHNDAFMQSLEAYRTALREFFAAL
ncbi:MAG: alpha/beta hydrolase [Verrucomicrobiota bacterium]